MPIVSVVRDELLRRLDGIIKTPTQPNIPSAAVDKEFDELCFEFGIELDDVTSERLMQEKEHGDGAAAAADLALGSDEILYKIDIPANRYDLLCLEGIVHALRVFRETSKPANFRLSQPAQMQVMHVKKETQQVRPVVVAAVLRNLQFDEVSYQSFIDLQEKLHHNICRKRQLVSVGTHDLDTLEGPFSYEALKPAEISFAPLCAPNKVMNGEELFAHIDEHERHLKKFLHLIRESPIWPVIFDSKRRVLSLPPIINSDHSKITLKTKNVLIEVTALDHTKANIVLNTICAMFSEYCREKFSVEPVRIDAEDAGTGFHGTNNAGFYPNFTPVEFECDVSYLNSGCGLSLSAKEQATYLQRMSLDATPSSDGKSLNVKAPITRSDILHACDVQEDLAIAYGYDNLNREFPPTLAYGKQQPLNKLSDLLRREVASSGYSEVLTLSLCSREDIFENIRQTPSDDAAVFISNPQTLEFQVARTTLLPGMLKTCHHNRDAPLPIRIFEISDVVLRNESRDTGACNQRRMCAIYSSKSSGLEHVHGLLDRVMEMQRIQWEGSTGGKSARLHYRIEEWRDNPTYLADRCARVLLNDQPIGYMGVVHPHVLQAFRVAFPCSALEINLEAML